MSQICSNLETLSGVYLAINCSNLQNSRESHDKVQRDSGSPLTDNVGANKRIGKDSGSCPARLAVPHEDLAGEEERVPRRPRDLDRRIKPSHTVRPRTFTVVKTSRLSEREQIDEEGGRIVALRTSAAMSLPFSRMAVWANDRCTSRAMILISGSFQVQQPWEPAGLHDNYGSALAASDRPSR